MDVAALSPGRVVDRYMVESFIGEGGMATVVKVRHQQLGTAHAMKVLNVSSGSVRDRLVQEGRLQASLQHENVVKVTDLVLLDGGAPGLIMELVEGPNLEELLTDDPPNLAQADHLAQGILRGVEEAHRHGLVHRDLKPANILLHPSRETWVPKVADFGIAKVLAGDGNHSGYTRTGMTMGTPNYMAPEQARDAKNIGPTADIFALGAILYEILTNRRAFEGNDLLDTLNAVAEARYTPILEHRPNTPAGMVRAIEAALQVDVADRPQTVDELRQLWLDGRPPRTTPVPFDNVGPRERAPRFATNATISRDRLAGATVTPPVEAASIRISDPPITTPPRNPAGMVALVSGLLAGLFLVGGAAAAMVYLGQHMQAPEVAEAPATPPAPEPTDLDEPAPPEPEPPADPGLAADPEPVVAPEPVTPEPVAAPEPVTPEPVAAPEPVVADAAPAPVPTAGTPAPRPPPEPVADPPVPDSPTIQDAVDGIAAIDVADPPAVVIAPKPAPAAAPAPTEPALEGYAADANPQLRKRGIKNLAYRTDVDARYLIGRLMRDDPDPGVRRFAWETVEDLLTKGDPHMDVLEDFAGWQIEHGEVSSALEALRALKSRGNRPGLLAPGLRRRSIQVRLATLDAVADLPPVDRLTLRSEVERLIHEADEKLATRARAVLSTMR